MVGLVALGAVPHRGVTVPPHLGAAGAHDPLVHRSLHAVVLLDVELGEGVVVEHGRLADVTERGGVDDVPVGGRAQTAARAAARRTRTSMVEKKRGGEKNDESEETKMWREANK